MRAEVVRAGLVNRGRAVAVRRSLEGAGELIKGLASDVATGVEARPRRFRGQDVAAVRIESRDKGTGTPVGGSSKMSGAGGDSLRCEAKRARALSWYAPGEVSSAPWRPTRSSLRAGWVCRVFGLRTVEALREATSLRELRERVIYPRDSAQGRTEMPSSDMWWPLVILRSRTMK